MTTELENRPASDTPPIAALEGVSRHYKVRLGGAKSATLRAVDDVDVAVVPGRTLGLVGESGSGKSTIARLMLRLVDVTAGRVLLDGEDITHSRGRRLRAARSRMQLVFQDPFSSFDPLSTIDDSLAEALRSSGLTRAGKASRAAELLETVGISPLLGQRRPRELSGGQLQRAAIARALAVEPALIILDEPVSSLDVSSQVHIIDLLGRLQADFGVAMLFISHDLTVVRDVSDDLSVMYLGKIVETGAASSLYGNPRHPYTEALLSAAPRMAGAAGAQTQRIMLNGDVPSPLDPPAGCRFHTRCPKAIEICGQIEPLFTPTADGNLVACHLNRGESAGLVLPQVAAAAPPRTVRR
jgi:oligopeptide/dipeptide ABC transporter ATP-binding protein